MVSKPFDFKILTVKAGQAVTMSHKGLVDVAVSHKDTSKSFKNASRMFQGTFKDDSKDAHSTKMLIEDVLT